MEGRSLTATSPTAGFALVAVLWTSTLLAIIAVSILSSTRTDLLLARNAVLTARSEALADAGVYRAILGLIEPDPTKGWHADGRPHYLDLGKARIKVVIRPESGKFDLNSGQPGLFYLLLLDLGLFPEHARSLRDAVLAYRESGTEGLTAHPFLMIEDLMRVPGMTRALFSRLRPMVTVHTRMRAIDPARAEGAIVDALSRALSGESLSGERLSTGAGEAPQSRVVRHSERQAHGVYSIRSEARLADAAVFTREAVVELAADAPGAARFLRWQRSSSTLD